MCKEKQRRQREGACVCVCARLCVWGPVHTPEAPLNLLPASEGDMETDPGGLSGPQDVGAGEGQGPVCLGARGG